MENNAYLCGMDRNLDIHGIAPLHIGDSYCDYLLSDILSSYGEAIAHIRLDRICIPTGGESLRAKVFVGIPHSRTLILEPERIVSSEKLRELPPWISVGGFYDDAVVRLYDSEASPVWMSLFAGKVERKLSDFE